MDDRKTRIVRNEALFREVNEQVDALNEAGPRVDSIPAICECGSAACTEIVPIGRQAYDSVRAHPERFLVKPGHEIPDLEDVVEEHGDWAVVAKKPGKPREMAQESDPRR